MRVEYWSLLISLLALVVSGLAFYPELIKPFRLSVHDGGRVEFGINPYRVPSSEITIAVDLIFTNSGAATGVVRDVALPVTLPSGNSVLFRSFLVYADRTKNFTDPPPPPKLESFLSFEVAGNESVIRKIVFTPTSDQPTLPFGTGKYHADVFCKTSRRPEWEKYASLDFTVDDEDIEILRRSSWAPATGGGYRLNLVTRDKPTIGVEDDLAVLRRAVTSAR